jgi:cytoskeletal protein CcmA (bactofilin family)
MNPFNRRIQDTAGGPATYVAAGTKIVGTITGAGPYVFCGETRGDCDIDGPATLAESGLWTGVLRASDVIVAGRVEGDVIAAGRVEIAGTARISGSITGHSIAVEEGAVIEGEINVVSGQEPVSFEEKRKATAAES